MLSLRGVAPGFGSGGGTLHTLHLSRFVLSPKPQCWARSRASAATWSALEERVQQAAAVEQFRPRPLAWVCKPAPAVVLHDPEQPLGTFSSSSIPGHHLPCGRGSYREGMENHDDSPNGSFQIYPPKKRKLFDIPQHNDAMFNVVGGTSVVASANGSYTGCGNNCANDNEARDHCQTVVAQEAASRHQNVDQGCGNNCANDNEARDHCQTVVAQEAPSRHQNVDQGCGNNCANDNEARDHCQTVVAQEAPSCHQNVDQVDDIKSVVGPVSPLFYGCLWDGTILLKSCMKASVVVFFESGEKIQDIPWPEIIVIKGKVKLDEFEDFVQKLLHSRNRAIMVISLCWKVGSSKVGLKGMKEFARSFEVSKKVGFAEIYEGCSLYLSPRSEAIITILYEHGFLKEMPTVDTSQESLMGLVVLNRKARIKDSNDSKSETAKGPLCACAVGANSPTSVPCSDSHQATPYSNGPDMASVRHTSMVQSNIKKIEEIQGTCVNTQDVKDERIGEKVYCPEATIPNSPSRLASVIACQQSQVPQMSSHEVPSVLLTSPEIWQHVQPIKDFNCGPLGVRRPDSHFHVLENFTSAFKPYKNGLHRLAVQSQDVLGGAVHSDLATQKNRMVGPFSGSITQQKYASGTSGSPQARPLLLHPDSDGDHTPDAKDDLPEFDFPSVCGAEVKPKVFNKEIVGSSCGLIHHKLPDNQSGGQSQQPSHSFFQIESIRPHESVVAQGTSTNVCSEKTTKPISHCNKERRCFRNSDGIGKGDMTKWHNPKLDHEELYKTHADARPRSLPPITPRPQSPPKTEGLFIDRHPHLPSGCLNPPRDERLLPHHHPDVEAGKGELAGQGLFPRHPPPSLADEGLFPRHPPPVLANEGLFTRHRPPVLADQGLFRGHPRGLFLRHPPPALAEQDLFPRQPPPIPAYQGDQGFTAHPPIRAPGNFSSSGDHGNDYGPFPDHQHLMLGQRPGTSFASATSGNIRPPSGFAPRCAWRSTSHPRPENNLCVFERSVLLSGSGSTSGNYRSGNGSGIRPPSAGQQ